MLSKAFVILVALMLPSCTGVYIGLPGGPVQIGASVSSDDVYADVDTGPGSIGVSADSKKDDLFVEPPEDAEADEDDREGDR